MEFPNFCVGIPTSHQRFRGLSMKLNQEPPYRYDETGKNSNGFPDSESDEACACIDHFNHL